MSTSSSSKRRQFWRSDWFVGACIVAAVLMLWRSTDLFEGLERRFYDVASIQSSRQPSDRIAVIAIDDQSVANIGRWPWPRDVQAGLIVPEQLAKVVASSLAKAPNLRNQFAGAAPSREGPSAHTGYDPAAKAAAAHDPFAKTAVFSRPDGAALPPGGGGQRGSGT